MGSTEWEAQHGAAQHGEAQQGHNVPIVEDCELAQGRNFWGCECSGVACEGGPWVSTAQQTAAGGNHACSCMGLWYASIHSISQHSLAWFCTAAQELSNASLKLEVKTHSAVDPKLFIKHADLSRLYTQRHAYRAEHCGRC